MLNTHQTWHLRREPEGLYIEHCDPLASPPVALIPVTVDALHVLAAQAAGVRFEDVEVHHG